LRGGEGKEGEGERKGESFSGKECENEDEVEGQQKY
jgi:hypothetical protein